MFLQKHFSELGDGKCSLDEHKLAVQIAFGQMAQQSVMFRLPRTEQASNTEEALLSGFLPQFREDTQAGVAAVADDEVLFAGPARDGRGLVQAAVADGGFQFRVQRVADEARVMFVGPELLKGYDHRRAAVRVGCRFLRCPLRKMRLLKLAGDFIGCWRFHNLALIYQYRRTNHGSPRLRCLRLQ
ncbi:hypothetical protein D3C72_1595720 [compost metagenome]